MVVSKANAGNLVIGGGIATGTGTLSLEILEIISANSVVIGLAISAIGIFGGLAINFYFKHKELQETKRHNERLEELTAQNNSV